ncbi:MAG: GumC family protein, partial [Fidelibacterota bacterium]
MNESLMNVQNQQFEDEISLKDIYYILRRNINPVVWISAIVLILSVIITLLQTPVYESSVTIMIDEKNQTMNVFDLGFTEDMNMLNNEMEILKSRTLAEEVVKHLWDSPQRNNLFLFGTALYVPEGIRYTARKVLSFGLWEPDSTSLPNYSGAIDDSVFTKAVKTVRNSMEVSNQRNTNIITLTVQSTSADEAALIANAMVEIYQKWDQELNAGELINLTNFLVEQADKVQRDLAVVEDSLRAFQEREQIYGLEGNAELLLKQLTDVESSYYTTLAEVNIVKERKRYVSDQLSREEKELSANLLNTINDKVFALRSQIAQEEGDLVRQASLHGENHEIVKSKREEVRKLKDELERQTKTLIAKGMAVADPIKYRQSMIDTLLMFEGYQAGLESRAGEYKKLVDQYADQLSALPAKSLQFARLERDRTVLADTYMLMRQKLEEAKITQASQLGKVRIIDPAIPPKERSKPNSKMNVLLGLILGLGLGVGAAFFIEYLDNTIKSVEDLEKKGLTVLGIIPSIGDAKYQKKYKKKGKPNPESARKHSIQRMQRRIITQEDPKSPISEAYRSLRTSIMYSSPDKIVKSIVISSAGPGEGKTTTISNLAITYANLGKKTLLLDADLRRPVIHRVFGLDKENGLTKYLAGGAENFNELVQKSDIPNLYVVTAGIVPPNPSELLGSKKMAELIDRLEQEYDMVCLDSPPLVAVTDATLISKEIDQLILVTKSGGTDKNAFARTLQALKNVDVPLAGVVLNGVTSKNSYG